MTLAEMRKAAEDELKALMEHGRSLEQEYQRVQSRLQQLVGKLEGITDMEKASKEPSEVAISGE